MTVHIPDEMGARDIVNALRDIFPKGESQSGVTIRHLSQLGNYQPWLQVSQLGPELARVNLLVQIAKRVGKTEEEMQKVLQETGLRKPEVEAFRKHYTQLLASARESDSFNWLSKGDRRAINSAYRALAISKLWQPLDFLNEVVRDIRSSNLSPKDRDSAENSLAAVFGLEGWMHGRKEKSEVRLARVLLLILRAAGYRVVKGKKEYIVEPIPPERLFGILGTAYPSKELRKYAANLSKKFWSQLLELYSKHPEVQQEFDALLEETAIGVEERLSFNNHMEGVDSSKISPQDKDKVRVLFTTISTLEQNTSSEKDKPNIRWTRLSLMLLRAAGYMIVKDPETDTYVVKSIKSGTPFGITPSSEELKKYSQSFATKLGNQILRLYSADSFVEGQFETLLKNISVVPE